MDGWVLCLTARIPATRPLFQWGCRRLARNRHCARRVGGNCRLPNDTRTRRFIDFAPLLILPLLALQLRPRTAPWIFMWLMALALYAGCKWLTFRAAMRLSASAGVIRSLGYLFAWPGMDAAEFLDARHVPERPHALEWALAGAKTVFGAVLLWGIAKWALPVHPLIAGWIGMTGVVFLLHFGLFYLLSLAWRSGGVAAAPIMKCPLLACSLGEFWGRRWNTAFNELAFRFTFRPLCRLTTPVFASVLVFDLSGLVHELVISLPARGGYGLPTAYFLIQGLGVVAERTRLGRHLGLGRGLRGWLFTMVVTAGPACCLFHPWFINRVILPMLTAIGAT